jgi:hypothetical protein
MAKKLDELQANVRRYGRDIQAATGRLQQRLKEGLDTAAVREELAEIKRLEAKSTSDLAAFLDELQGRDQREFANRLADFAGELHAALEARLADLQPPPAPLPPNAEESPR